LTDEILRLVEEARKIIEETDNLSANQSKEGLRSGKRARTGESEGEHENLGATRASDNYDNDGEGIISEKKG